MIKVGCHVHTDIIPTTDDVILTTLTADVIPCDAWWRTCLLVQNEPHQLSLPCFSHADTGSSGRVLGKGKEKHLEARNGLEGVTLWVECLPTIHEAQG